MLIKLNAFKNKLEKEILLNGHEMDCNESVSKVETIFFAQNLTKKSNDKKIIKGITKEFQINVYFLDKKHKIKRIVKSIKIL